jgi:hypothetical protein
MNARGWNEIPARELTEDERATLDFLLSVDFPDREAFREQARTIRADAVCDCGCASVRLVVDERLPRAGEGHSYAIVDSSGRPAPDRAPADLTLFAKDGRLFCMDVTAYDAPPHPPWNPFPPLGTFSSPRYLR